MPPTTPYRIVGLNYACINCREEYDSVYEAQNCCADACQHSIGSDDICGLAPNANVHDTANVYGHEFLRAAGVAQSAEQVVRNNEVAGSTPVSSSNKSEACSVCGQPIVENSINPTGWTHSPQNDKSCMLCPLPLDTKKVEEVQGFTDNQRELMATIVRYRIEIEDTKKSLEVSQKEVITADKVHKNTVIAQEAKQRALTASLKAKTELLLRNEDKLRRSILEDITLKGLPDLEPEKEQVEAELEVEQIGRAE